MRGAADELARNNSVSRACRFGRDGSASSAARVRAFCFAAHSIVAADVPSSSQR